MSVRCLVIGIGKMGQAHLQSLIDLDLGALAAYSPSDSRKKTVKLFSEIQYYSGDLADALRAFAPSHVIVASPVETLAPNAMLAMEIGIKNILIEKPAALNIDEGTLLKKTAILYGADVYVGYNRRFYSSIRTALSLISEAGERIESSVLEFNEVVASNEGPTGQKESVRARWLLANSLHVLDSAFFPIGYPDVGRSHFCRSGTIGWHPSGQVFVGSGLTTSGVPFAYHANWAGPGRWGFEWVTPSARYIFRPLEQLSVMRRSSFNLETITINDEFDRRYKPGVFLQNRCFLTAPQNLVSLDQALQLLKVGEIVGGY
jgi:predicted dehydrogenase